jgi:HTH-type transcriptional regulator / antitoxin MqsA
MKEKPCPFCNDGKLTQCVRPLSFNYKGSSIKIDQPGQYCNSCDEGIVHGSDIKATEKALHNFRAKIDGFLTTEEIRLIRSKLNLTQQQAAVIFGGGTNAFSRYERGEVRQTKALDQLLRLLDKHPHLLEEVPRDEAA